MGSEQAFAAFWTTENLHSVHTTAHWNPEALICAATGICCTIACFHHTPRPEVIQKKQSQSQHSSSAAGSKGTGDKTLTPLPMRISCTVRIRLPMCTIQPHFRELIDSGSLSRSLSCYSCCPICYCSYDVTSLSNSYLRAMC